MAKLAQLKSQRNICLNRLLETEQTAQSALNDSTLHSALKVRSKFIDSYLKEFMDVHLQIINSTKDAPELEAEDAFRKRADDAFFSISCTINDLFSVDTVSGNNNKHSHNVPQNIKLPKISIPRFDGDLKFWGTFRDMFQNLIHNNLSLSSIEKFQYLISSLSKTPLSIVSKIPVSDENYPIAYKALQDRYQNKRLLATNHWYEIQKIPTLVSDNPEALRHLLDTFSENLAALELLDFPVEHWDFILFNLLLDKTDTESRKHFEREHSTIELPSFKQLQSFLSNLCVALQRAKVSISKTPCTKLNKNYVESSGFPKHKSSFVVNCSDTINTTHSLSCVICKSNHVLSKCSEFLRKSPHDRYLLVKDKKFCVNCLGQSHNKRSCQSSFTCRICRAPHHTLLHFNSNSPDSPSVAIAPISEEQMNAPQTALIALKSNTNCFQNSPQTILANTINNRFTLLSTAIIQIVDAWGNLHNLRALLDSASQVSLITDKCARKLGLPRLNSIIPIEGVGQNSAAATKGIINCQIRSTYNNFSSIIECVILNKICGDMPNCTIDSSNWRHIAKLKLADPNFGTPGRIDILLGADIFPDVIQNGKIVGNPQQPAAMNTVFGWILMGSVANTKSFPRLSLIAIKDSKVNIDLKKFWELEEIPTHSLISPEDALCESIYKNSHSRTHSGRYTVALPFKGADPFFSDTRSVALRRFRSLERRLMQDSTLHRLYTEFMRDYLDTGHMEPISDPTISNKTFYIPHHCVLKPDSLTTKLRVVFDASARVPGESSLNEHLLIGPKLQKDIVTLLLNFRLNPIVFTADIKQMYRQILIKPSHCDYQRILWRFDLNDPIQDFRLKTVTYGVASAPFLALRTLHQLSLDEAQNYPLAAQILQSDIYVDDIVSGASSLEQALALQEQLVSILKIGGFELRKWASNHPALLSAVPPDHRQQSLSFDRDSNSSIKILGLQWLPHQDIFSYKAHATQSTCSKRTILSDIAKIFDPLGFLAPLTFLAKRIIQHLWCLGLDWDEVPPQEILNRWSQYKLQLPELSKVKIPRHINVKQASSCQFHGFCDASESGFAAVVYLRCVINNQTISSLICGKSKVAPLQRVSLPRLELCAAFLLSNLMTFVLEVYKNSVRCPKVFAWTDSTVVLAWLDSSPHRWKTFVSNRVSHIQDRIAPQNWHHISSPENPADCASRGLLPSELINHPLWWSGPAWLLHSEGSWPISDLKSSNDDSCLSTALKEERKLTLIATLSPNTLEHLLNRFSSLSKLKRIIAYCSRFVHNIRQPLNKHTGALGSIELHNALLLLVKQAQYSTFNAEIQNLRQQKDCSKPIRKLNPFLDKDGLVRVGGRLTYSNLSFEQKHPLLLPRNHRLTELIIDDTHRNNSHPGLKTLHYLLLQQFWILSAKRAIRHLLLNCIRCFRCKPIHSEPFMGNLPSVRINQVKCFSNVGVDYGGPFIITLGKSRGAKTYKGYLCLFICLATKALHLELASDLSSDAFLAALRRFIARRGRCTKIYSDCGTNFVGAQRQLMELMKTAVEAEHISWNFNPPSAPHFGGIWEAGIKSVKTHLSRVIGNQILTYEEFYTVLTQVESLLNSRPLCELSPDPNDCAALTPGHFLTLEPLTAPPEINALATSPTFTSRFLGPMAPRISKYPAKTP